MKFSFRPLFFSNQRVFQLYEIRKVTPHYTRATVASSVKFQRGKTPTLTLPPLALRTTTVALVNRRLTLQFRVIF